MSRKLLVMLLVLAFAAMAVAGCGGDKKADRRRRGLRHTGIADQEKRVTGKERSPVQSSRRRQIEHGGTAAKLKQDRGKDADAGSLFHHP